MFLNLYYYNIHQQIVFKIFGISIAYFLILFIFQDAFNNINIRIVYVHIFYILINI